MAGDGWRNVGGKDKADPLPSSGDGRNNVDVEDVADPLPSSGDGRNNVGVEDVADPLPRSGDGLNNVGVKNKADPLPSSGGGWHDFVENNPEPLPSSEDIKAYDEQRAETLKIVQTSRERAASWVAGIQALIALLGTILVFSGPDSMEALNSKQRKAIVVLIVAAFLFLAISLLLIYESAFGFPEMMGNDSQEQEVLRNFHTRLIKARLKVASKIKWWTRIAFFLSFLGSSLVFAAIIVSWF